MAINWGALAGGATKGFVDTYKMLSEEEERELALKEKRDRMAREAQARTAALETIGRANTDTYAPELQARGAGTAQAKALEQQNAGFGSEGYQEASRATAGALSREAVPTEMKSRVYKESEAVGDYARRLAAIDPDKALATSTQARQIKQFERTEEIQAKFDEDKKKVNTDFALIEGTKISGGLKGMTDLAKKNGLNVKFVEGANGVGRIEVLGKDGKVTQTFTDVDQAADALKALRMKEFMTQLVGLTGSPEAAVQMWTQQQTQKLAEKRDVREEQKLPGDMALTASQTAYNQARAANTGKETSASVVKNLASTADILRRQLSDIDTARANVNPGSKEDATLLAQRNAVNRQLSDVTSQLMSQQGLIKPSATTGAQTGVNPKLQAIMDSGINPDTNKPFTSAEITEFEKNTGIKYTGPRPGAKKEGPKKEEPIGDPNKPLPPGLPVSDIEARTARAQQTAAKQAAEKAAAKTASQQASAKLTEEAAGLTADRIKALKPSEAASMIRKYNSVLSSEQRKLLNKQL